MRRSLDGSEKMTRYTSVMRNKRRAHVKIFQALPNLSQNKSKIVRRTKRRTHQIVTTSVEDPATALAKRHHPPLRLILVCQEP